MTQIEWMEVARRGKNHSVMIIDQVMESYRRGLLGPTLDSDFSVHHYRQLAGARWMSRRDIDGYVAALSNGEKDNPGMLLRKANDRSKVVARMKEFADSVKLKGNGEEYISTFMEMCIELWATAYHYIMLNRFYPDLLTAEVAAIEKDVHKQNEYLKILLELPEPTDSRREKNSMLEIALAVHGRKNWQRDTEITAMIEKHVSNYAHLGYHYWWGKPYSAGDVRQRIADLLSGNLDKEVQLAKEQEKVNEKTEEIFQKLKFGDAEKLMVANLRAWGYTANYADEVYQKCVLRISPYVQQACKGWNISWNQFASMRVSELYNIFENGIDENFERELAARARDHAIILNNPEVIVFSGKQLEEYKKKELAEEKAMHHLQELHGQSVCPGIVKGKARLIYSVDDVPMLMRGEILVADSTFPAFVPAMERAAAVVTNEGGLLCHAAIVSRELNKPCIVGTRFATKVFRNGDEVEVDATNGVIRKLKR